MYIYIYVYRYLHVHVCIYRTNLYQYSSAWNNRSLSSPLLSSAHGPSIRSADGRRAAGIGVLQGFGVVPGPPKIPKIMDPILGILSILGVLGHLVGHFGSPGRGLQPSPKGTDTPCLFKVESRHAVNPSLSAATILVQGWIQSLGIQKLCKFKAGSKRRTPGLMLAPT